MRFGTAIFWNSISQFGQTGIQFLSTIILARLLTPDDFGVVGMVNIFIIISQVMVDSEMGGALLRKREVSRVDYSTLFYYNLGISILIYSILFFIAPLISDLYARTELTSIIRILGICVLIHAFRVVQKIMIFRDLKFRNFAIINLSSGILSLVGAIILAKYGWGYWALVAQQIITAIFNVIFLEISNRFIPVLRFSKDSFRYQFKFGISLLSADLILSIANNISTNIVAKVTTLNSTGLYTQVNKLTTFTQSASGAILNQSVFPLLAKIEDKHKIDCIYHKFYIISCLSITFISLILICFPEFIINIILGKDWLGGAPMLRILSLTSLPLLLQVLGKNILKALNSTKIVMYLSIVKSIILISILLIGAHWGFIYILWGLVISQVITASIWIIVVDKKLGYKSYLRLSLLYLFMAIMLSVLVILS